MPAITTRSGKGSQSGESPIPCNIAMNKGQGRVGPSLIWPPAQANAGRSSGVPEVKHAGKYAATSSPGAAR
jgi:hypothetical protein